jgi:hypothetical protein
MREEFRFFLRIGLYLLAAGIVYWFVTYEAAGTVLLIGVFVGVAFFILAAGAETKLFTRGRAPIEMIGFTEGDDPLDIEEDVVSPGSIWPLMAAVAMLLLALGFLYGTWFWLPGAGLAGVSAWMWLTELVR